MSEDIPITTFHFGFLLTCAFASATMHLMLIIGQPDLTQYREWKSWKNHLRFLQTMMFLPLAGFFLSHVATEPDAAFWFLGTLIVSVTLFVPAEMQLNSLRPKPTRGLIDDTINATNQSDQSNSLTVENSQKNNPNQQEPNIPKRTALDSPKMGRLLVANFCLGLVMGASIVAPMALMVGSLKIATLLHLINEAQSQWALALVPALTSFAVPLLMPYLFLSLGPMIIQFTQNTEKVSAENHPNIHKVWTQVCHQIQALGLNTKSRNLHLHLIPQENLNQSNAFFMGWPGRLSLFSGAIFVSSDLPNKLNSKQLEFIIAHELVHDIKAHAKRRVAKGLGIFITFVAAQALALMTGSLAFSLVITVAVLVAAHFSFKHQSHHQELEADTMALSIIGRTAENCQIAESVLLLIDRINQNQLSDATTEKKTQESMTHPALYARLQNLKIIGNEISQTAPQAIKSSDDEKSETKKAA